MSRDPRYNGPNFAIILILVAVIVLIVLLAGCSFGLGDDDTPDVGTLSTTLEPDDGIQGAESTKPLLGSKAEAYEGWVEGVILGGGTADAAECMWDIMDREMGWESAFENFLIDDTYDVWEDLDSAARVETSACLS